MSGMKIIFIVVIVATGIGILFYIANYSVSVGAVPSLGNYIATKKIDADLAANTTQPSADWLASASAIKELLPDDFATSTPNSTTKIVPRSLATKQILPKVSVKVKESSTDITTGASLKPIRTSKGVIYVSVARTPATRAIGLSGRASMKADEGMLFIFPKPDIYDFWMKDMNFPIDIVWMDADRKIIGVTRDISPETYPKSFISPGKVQFVLEVNANSAEKLGLVEGTHVSF